MNTRSETSLPLKQLGRVLRSAALVLLVAAAFVLMARRLAGQLTDPLPGGWLVVGAGLLALSASLLRRPDLLRGIQYSVLSTEYSVLSNPNLESRITRPGATVAAAVPGVAAALVLLAITLPGTPRLSVALAWFLFIAAEAANWLPRLSRTISTSRSERPRSLASSHGEEETEEELESIPEAVVQQITRERTAEGAEAIHAVLRVPVEAGDNLAIAHLAFCPPLASEPTLEAHVLGDSGAESRVTLAQSFGARIEVRRTGATQNLDSVLIEVIGKAAGTGSGEPSGG